MNERRDIGFGSPMKMIAQKRQCFVDNMCFSYIKMKSQNNTPSEQCLNYTRKSSKRSQHGDFITLTYTGVMGVIRIPEKYILFITVHGNKFC